MGSSQGAFDYEVAILGGGSAGYAAARTAAAARLRTVVIEGGEEVGGLCILRGCMPSKALLYAAEVMHLARQAALWGIEVKAIGFNFAKVMARKNAMVKEFADDRRQQLLSGKFEFIRAQARFTDPHTLRLNTGQTVTAKSFIVCTGSVVAPSPLPELAEVGYLDSDRALALTKLPESFIVLGGGAVGVELAQFFARFGVKVTLVQRSQHLLREVDPDAADELKKVFQREGIEVFTNTKLIGARCVASPTHLNSPIPSPLIPLPSDGRGEAAKKCVSFHHEGREAEVSADEILFALGRIPNTASLGLEKAGVKTKLKRIVANSRMQTSAPHVYTAGDCTSPHEIVHIAVQQGEVAAHNIAHPGEPREMDYRLLTEVVFTDPQIATVGLTEQRAMARGIPYLAASYPFNDHGKSLIMEARDGFVKLLADPASGEILGGGCIGPAGGELIHEIIAAMSKRMTVQELAAMPHYHPTLAEIWTYPAEELAGKITSSANNPSPS
jgi:pyruvate/2-oxoglutarate dehydrogenase complex dihydrolipoamide dehydrogenase (E3) component